MANVSQVNRGVLMEKNLCLYIGVPFTPEQEKELLKCKTKDEKSALVLKWREKYVEVNHEGIIKDALKLPKNKISEDWKVNTPKKPEVDKELVELKAKYFELYGKNIPVKEQSNKEFIRTKIAEAEKANLVQKFELLDEEAVKSLLTDKEIEIPEGTEGKEALVNIAIQTGIFPEDA